MKLENNGIVKEIEKSLVPDYLAAGWKEHKETKKENKAKAENKPEKGKDE